MSWVYDEKVSRYFIGLLTVVVYKIKLTMVYTVYDNLDMNMEPLKQVVAVLQHYDTATGAPFTKFLTIYHNFIVRSTYRILPIFLSVYLSNTRR